MIYLLYGDRIKGLEKAKKIVASQKVKDKDATHHRVDAESFSQRVLEELSQSGGLFQSKIVVILDSLFSNTDTREEMISFLKTLVESQNIFILVEETLPKDLLTKLEKKAEKTEIIQTKEKTEKKKQEFNIFSLADALGNKDKKMLWTLFAQARGEGILSEEIHRILLWQMKAILISMQTNTPQEGGLAPFVYTKASRYAKQFTFDEAEKLSWNLIEILHDSRKGKDMDVMLEKFVLTLG